MKQKMIIGIFILLFFSNNLFSQERVFSKKSITTSLGLAFNAEKNVDGIGILTTIGYQKSIGEKERFRINPTLTKGEFVGFIHSSGQIYRSTAFSYLVHYDVFKYKSISLVVGAGAFVNYSRGHTGTSEGRFSNHSNESGSRYFRNFYYGGQFSFGFRFSKPNKRFAYEFRPISVMLGNDGLETISTLNFGLEIRLN